LRGRPTVPVFYRGNWCPLCMAQVGEIAARWRDVEAMGAQVALVSPQDEDHTRSLAARHGVGFRYLRDEGLVVARRLGILDSNGTPAGMIGYDGNTVQSAVGRIAHFQDAPLGSSDSFGDGRSVLHPVYSGKEQPPHRCSLLAGPARDVIAIRLVTAFRKSGRRYKKGGVSAGFVPAAKGVPVGGDAYPPSTFPILKFK